MASDRSAKDKAMSSYLKERGVTRTTGACPWGCGKGIAIGGQPLLIHLNTCKGRSKVAR